MDAELDRKEFLRLILGGDRREAERHASRIFDDHGAGYLYEQVIQPALYEVGRLWQSNCITVADEHLATLIAESSIAGLYAQFPWPTGGPRVVLGCAEGERHELGARMVADLLALHGWDELFLGADVPTEHFASKVREVAPRMVAISVTVDLHLAAARAVIEAVRRARPTAKILVGGLATRELYGADALGADAIAQSGSEAVEIASHWDTGATETAFHDGSTRRDLERLREEWAAMVAHDLRQPVQTIVLAAELLLQLRSGEASGTERRTIERVRSASARLNRMITDLSEASQIESKRLSVNPRMVDVYGIVQALVEDQRAQNLKCSLRAPSPEQAQAWVDPDRFHQILGNLLSNAVKYGEKGTEINVDVVPSGDVLEVIVTNHGPGIPPEQLPHVFSRFTRTRGARESGRPGLGLGLYIAKGLVEAHGGRLWVESVPGHTTSFHVVLLMKPGVVSAEAEARGHLLDDSGTRERSYATSEPLPLVGAPLASSDGLVRR